MKLIAQVKKYIEKHNMMQAGDRILIGLSGGGDSVCLLCVLRELREELGISLAALHVHHGIRGQEADEDADFCRCLCEAWGVPCEVVYLDIPGLAAREKLSMEEAARKGRYHALEEARLRLGAASVAVAHHREDNAETVLWNLFRGTGLKGLGGIEPVNGRVIRPLLECSREQLLAYLEAQEAEWQQDATNDSDLYTRNRIRHHVLEYAVKEINTRSAEHICQAAATAAQADGYLRRQAQRWLHEPGNAFAEGEKQVTMELPALRQEEEILQTYILREALCCFGELKDVSARHMQALHSLMDQAPGAGAAGRVELPGGITARRSYDKLTISAVSAKAGENAFDEAGIQTVVDLAGLGKESRIEPGKTIEAQFAGISMAMRMIPYEKTQKIPVNRYTKWLDCDKIERMLVFRYRRPGDYFMLPGGKRKTVKAYMIDEKIPVTERDKILLAAQGSHVLWIVGYRLSEGAKVTEDTACVLELKIYGGKEDGNHSCVDS